MRLMPFGYKKGENRMSSKSPEFLTVEAASDKKGRKNAAGRKSSLIESVKADLILMLAGDTKDIGKIPLFYFLEGNA